MAGKKKERGLALLIVIFAMMMLAILGWSLTALLSSNFEGNARNLNSEQALYLADSGIQWARHELEQSSSWRTDSAHGYPSGYALFSLATGQMQVACRNPVPPESGDAIIVSTGYVPAMANYAGMRQVKLIVTFGSAFSLANALYSTGDVNMSGQSKVYNGDITSNGDVNMSAQSGIVNGDVTENAPGEPPPAISVPPELASLSSLGTLSVGGQSTSTISAGNYKYSSISLSGQSKLNISGDVVLYLTGASSLAISGQAKLNILSGGSLTVYVDGAVSIGGQGVSNASHDVNSLTIYGTENNTSTITLSGQGDFYGVIYAPSTNLSISGQGTYYGAYTGNNITLSGQAKVYYDPSLATRTIGSEGGETTLSWRET